jgi:hypothetical protein
MRRLVLALMGILALFAFISAYSLSQETNGSTVPISGSVSG